MSRGFGSENKYCCFDCRKPNLSTEVCAFCKGETVNMGIKFQPPKFDDMQQWVKCKLLAEYLRNFTSCKGVDIYINYSAYSEGHTPDKLSEVEDFLKEKEILKNEKDFETFRKKKQQYLDYYKNL